MLCATCPNLLRLFFSFERGRGPMQDTWNLTLPNVRTYGKGREAKTESFVSNSEVPLNHYSRVRLPDRERNNCEIGMATGKITIQLMSVIWRASDDRLMFNIYYPRPQPNTCEINTNMPHEPDTKPPRTNKHPEQLKHSLPAMCSLHLHFQTIT